ncbi:hypothetical protein F4804DRAFT_305079 [Jackrogersella minutella]|nr:hypothetical protein F4804DRAFT_305079 [Jackrogersella minutella]
MSIPFICRQCIARLTRSHVGRFRPKSSQSHFRAISTSTQQPTWTFSEAQMQDTSIGYDVTDDHEAEPFTSYREEVVPEAPQDGSVLGENLEYIRRIPHLPKKSKLPHISRDDDFGGLRKKILASHGPYRGIRSDLVQMYGMSVREARHAALQLERLFFGQPAMVEAGHRLDRFHEWKKHFNELTELAKNTLPTTTEANVDSAKTDTAMQNEHTVKDTWDRYDQARRESLWPSIIISVLRSRNVDTLPTFIRDTMDYSWCPSYIIEDVMSLLLYSLRGAKDVGSRRQEVIDLVYFLVDASPPRYLIVEQSVIRRMIQRLPIPRLLMFYEALQRIQHPLHSHTLLQLASRLAHVSKYKLQAAQIIHSIPTASGFCADKPFNINSPSGASVCSTLLTIEEGDELPGEDAAPDVLFKLLLEAGHRPNMLNLSAIIRNFCLRGRLEVAWSIFNNLIEFGMEPDAYVFSILLNGSKQNLDIESLRRDVDMIEGRKVWSLFHLNDFLDFIYRYGESQEEARRHNRKRITAKAWRLMVQLYAKYFKKGLLQKFTLFPLRNMINRAEDDTPIKFLKEINRLIANLPQQPKDKLLEPDTITLEVMFRAHFRTLEDPRLLRMYYRHFMELLKKEDPTIIQFIKDRGTVVRDMFLRDFMQFEQTYRVGIQMVEFMHLNAAREVEKHGKNEIYIPPSLHTYTILINGLRNHRQCRGAIKALNMMISAGLTPNLVTWNIIIKALLWDQRYEQAVMVLQHLEQIGLRVNDRTMQQFTQLGLDKRRRIADIMTRYEKHPVDLKDQRAFAETLLQVWERQLEEIPDIDMRLARKINQEAQSRFESARAENERGIGLDGEEEEEEAGYKYDEFDEDDDHVRFTPEEIARLNESKPKPREGERR